MNFLSDTQILNVFTTFDAEGRRILTKDRGKPNIKFVEEMSLVVAMSKVSFVGIFTKNGEILYNISILYDQFLDQVHDIKTICNIKIVDKDLPKIILVHLKNTGGPEFRDSDGSFIILNRHVYEYEFEKNKTYLMEIDNKMNIRNVIYNIDDDKMISIPSWYEEPSI